MGNVYEQSRSDTFLHTYPPTHPFQGKELVYLFHDSVRIQACFLTTSMLLNYKHAFHDQSDRFYGLFGPIPVVVPVPHPYTTSIYGRDQHPQKFSLHYSSRYFTLSDHAGSVPSVVVLSHLEERSSDSSVAVSFHETLTLRSLEHSSFRYVRMFTSTYVRFGPVTSLIY